MAFSVRSTSKSGTGNTTISLTGVAAGAALVLGIVPMRDGTTAPTIPLTGAMVTGDLVAKANTISSTSGYGGKSQIFVALNQTVGDKTVSLTFAGDSYWFITLSEVIGVALSSAVDVVATTGTGTSTAPSTGTTAATAQADEIAFAVMHHAYNGTDTITEPAGWTLIGEDQAGSTTVAGSVICKVLTATGTQNATWTSNRNAAYNAIMVTLKGASAPPSASGQMLQMF